MDEKSAAPTSSAPEAGYSRKNPFLAELTRHELLTKPGSEKETRHFVVSLAGSGLTYTPGQSQTLMVVVNDAVAATYGFQLSARMESGAVGCGAFRQLSGKLQFVGPHRGDAWLPLLRRWKRIAGYCGACAIA